MTLIYGFTNTSQWGVDMHNPYFNSVDAVIPNVALSSTKHDYHLVIKKMDIAEKKIEKLVGCKDCGFRIPTASDVPKM